MRRTRFSVLSVTVVALAAGFGARADATPALLPDGTWAAAPYSATTPSATAPLRAGAATGDITPPPGAPPTGFYVARHCGTSTGLELAGKAADKQRQIAEDPTEAPYVLSQCTAPRLGPDTDGYAKTFPASEGRFGRLRAQAFVLADGSRTVALVSVDLPGIFGEMHQAVANRVAHTGITRDDILISASHTHTGPGGYFQQNLAWAALGGDILDPRLFEAITAGITDAILTAHARLQPAKLAAGETMIQGVNGNRRGAQRALNPAPELAVDPSNAPRLGMIRVDSTDGLPLGVITNFSTHGTIGNTVNMWHTGDDKAWVGRLVEQGIRERSGAPASHPIVDATLNGAQGDIGSGGCSRPWSNMSGSDFSDLACMEGAGIRQANQYLALWESLGASMSTDVSLDARYDSVCFCGQYVEDDPYDPFDRGEWVPANDDPLYFNVANIAIQGEGKAPATAFPGHHRRTPLLIGPPGASPKNSRIQVLRVGKTAFASMPGEPTIQMGRRVERSVKSAFAGMVDRVWVAGLANDHNAYMSTIQEYEAYLYEGGWSFFGQQTGNLLKLRLMQMAERMALGQAMPACTYDRGCVENPDSSAITAEPEPLTPDVGAGEVASQPANVERFDGTNLTWYGGGPGAEWRPGEIIASLQREVAGEWVTVATDLDPVIPLKYGKRYGRHRYTAMFDPVASQPLGTYRFVVTGAYATGPATTEPYTLTSSEFTVSASSRLRLVKSGSAWQVEHPEPDRLKNFRDRTRTPASWSVSGILNGAPATFTGPFTLGAGDSFVVGPGGIDDGLGNTNGAEIAVTG